MDKDMLLNMIKEMTKDAEYWDLKNIRKTIEGALKMVDDIILERYGTIDISKKENLRYAPIDYERVILVMQKRIYPVDKTLKLVTSEGTYYLKEVDVDDAEFGKDDYGEYVKFSDKYGNYVKVRPERLERAIRILDALRGHRWTKNSYKAYNYYIHPDAPLVVFDGMEHIALIAPLMGEDDDEKVEGDS